MSCRGTLATVELVLVGNDFRDAMVDETRGAIFTAVDNDGMFMAAWILVIEIYAHCFDRRWMGKGKVCVCV